MYRFTHSFKLQSLILGKCNLFLFKKSSYSPFYEKNFEYASDVIRSTFSLRMPNVRTKDSEDSFAFRVHLVELSFSQTNPRQQENKSKSASRVRSCSSVWMTSPLRSSAAISNSASTALTRPRSHRRTPARTSRTTAGCRRRSEQWTSPAPSLPSPCTATSSCRVRCRTSRRSSSRSARGPPMRRGAKRCSSNRNRSSRSLLSQRIRPASSGASEEVSTRSNPFEATEGAVSEPLNKWLKICGLDANHCFRKWWGSAQKISQVWTVSFQI